MKTALSTLDLRRARSLDDALAVMRAEHRVPIAGATDLYVGLNFGTIRATRFLDLWPLDELRRISVADDRLVLGALVTYSALIASSAVRERLPMLIEAARQVGGVQIQNRGTIGGNIANGSPAGDSLPVFGRGRRDRTEKCGRRAACADHRVLHRLSRNPDAARRAHRRYRSSARRGKAVVPKGGHARCAGDLENRRGRSALVEAAGSVRQRRSDGHSRSADRARARIGRRNRRCGGGAAK